MPVEFTSPLISAYSQMATMPGPRVPKTVKQGDLAAVAATVSAAFELVAAGMGLWYSPSRRQKTDCAED